MSKGRTGCKCCVANLKTGACRTTPSMVSIAAPALRANATSGIPIVDANPSCLVANSRRRVLVAVAMPEPPQQTGPCGGTHVTPFLLSLTIRFEPPQLNYSLVTMCCCCCCSCKPMSSGGEGLMPLADHSPPCPQATRHGRGGGETALLPDLLRMA